MVLRLRSRALVRMISSSFCTVAAATGASTHWPFCITWREAAYVLVWPLAWLVWTLAVGQVDGWVPYPFLDGDVEGWASVAVVSVGITMLFLALFALARWLDRWLPSAPR